MESDDDFPQLLTNFARNPCSLAKVAQPLIDHARGLSALNIDETAAIALRSPKTAALFFDRVWGGLHFGMPEPIAFWTETDLELAMLIAVAMALPGEEFHDDRRRYDVLEAQLSDDPLTADGESLLTDATRTMAETIKRAGKSRTVVPVYVSAADRDSEYRLGDRTALVAVVQDLQVVSERDLTWEQVTEVRADAQATLNLRRMRHWLDREMVGKSRGYVEDEIALRIDAYEKTLRKHGLSATIGILATTLDSKTLLGGPAAVAALSYAGASEWAFIAGASIVVGKGWFMLPRRCWRTVNLRGNLRSVS